MLTVVQNSLDIVLQTLDLQNVETELLGVTLDTNLELINIVVGTCPTPCQILVSRLTIVTKSDGNIVVDVLTRSGNELSTELILREGKITVEVLVDGSIDGTSVGSTCLIVTELVTGRPV